MNENWKIIPFTRCSYSASDLGRIRSEARTIRYANGRPRTIPERIMKPSLNAGGYPVVNISIDNHKTTMYVHDLVLLAHRGAKPEGHETRHLNDIKTDCRLANLAFGDRSQNQQDAVRNGRNFMARRTECCNGHPYRPGSYRRFPYNPSVRFCLVCRRNRLAAAAAARGAA